VAALIPKLYRNRFKMTRKFAMLADLIALLSSRTRSGSAWRSCHPCHTSQPSFTSLLLFDGWRGLHGQTSRTAMESRKGICTHASGEPWPPLTNARNLLTSIHGALQSLGPEDVVALRANQSRVHRAP